MTNTKTANPKARNTQATETARKLRRDMTYPERLLWSRLRSRRLEGHKFRRQHAIPPFVVDFCCEEAGLVVELDGLTHVNRGESDASRTSALEHQGYAVMRVTNDEVLKDVNSVAEGIRLRIRELSTGL